MDKRREIPQGLTDESIWYKYFSLRSLLVAVGFIAVGIAIGVLIKGLGIGWPFAICWGVLTIVVTLMTLIRIPNTNWLKGGGEHIDQVLFKLLYRRRNRCIYIKGYDQLDYEEKNREMFRKLEEKEG